MVTSENRWGDTSAYTHDFMGNRVTVETEINTNGGGNRPDPNTDKVKTNNGRGIGVGQIPPGHQKRDIDLVNEDPWDEGASTEGESASTGGENTNKAGWGHQYNRTETRTEYVYDITSPYQDVLMEYGEHSQTQLYTYGVGRIAVDFNELNDANNGWIPKTAPTVIDPATERLYYIKDELGTTKRLIGEDGKASVSYSYYDFGSPDTTTHFDINWSGPDNLFGYTGYEWDKVAEMWYAKARYYNSDLARFTAEDPLKGNLLDIQSMNLYPYVTNNPLKYVDPDGRAKNSLCGEDIKYLSKADQERILKIKDLYDIIESYGNREKLDAFHMAAAIIRETGGRQGFIAADPYVYGPSSINITNEYSRGNSGNNVTLIQSALKNQGYNLGSWGVDGNFGQYTQGAVIRFQIDNGLYPDGRFGAEEAKELGISNLLKSNQPSGSIVTTSSLPKNGEPNSKGVIYNPDGSIKQEREYGPDGQVSQFARHLV